VVDLFTAAEEARRKREAADHEAAVAGTLATHLKADRFEKWLLDEAAAELLAGASTVLYELSAGAYSLELDARRDFAVVDHRNADERRPVRTLSGGETFLASLALALALAERVSLLAPGQVRLESLFLDEGFGTLDPEALDIVASAIEHLGASGRMIGVVTHVAELADRLPIRFDVRRGVDGSTIERVST
jgi:exonuclease SbcC